MRVLIIPDKFKGTLRADEAARAIAAGWLSARPGDQLELLPVSDGGDGFGEIVGQLIGAEKQISATINAAHEPIQASWWWSAESQTAVVESANIIGLAMLPPGRFHPFELDTLGLGQLMHLIAKEHPGARLIIGIGGSATNDGGFGMARGLGYRFLDLSGYCLDRWLALDALLRIEPPAEAAHFREITIACDVQNPLLGPEGASRIYGPQKGLRPEDFSPAEKSFTRLVEVVRSQMQKDCSDEPGTGAAGGLGYGLRVFADGQFEPGFDIFSRLSNLPQKIVAADLIITAEGSIDAQTEMGKGTGAIAALARQYKKRCIGLAGYLPQKENRVFDLALGIAPDLTTIDEALRNPTRWLEKLSALAAAKIPLLILALLSLFLSACSAPPTARNTPTPAESRAVAYLAREVPAWFRDNGCYSCHNNGDGARALFVASARGQNVKDSLTDTLAWLHKPSAWDDNKGDPAASDQRLADIQFALALATASRANLITDPTILTSAARRLVPHQAADGAWHVESQNDVGSPVTYGTTLATYYAWKILGEANDPANSAALSSAAKWLSQIQPKNIPAAAALLLFAANHRHHEKQFTAQSYLLKHQLSSGGWGPYPNAPAEIFDTALALLALTSANTRDPALERARAYLESQQNTDGSWPATTRPTCGESYAQQISTSAWATLALMASRPH
ncbi:MAG: glycerate kinase [Limisphaerales bacterium]